MRIRAAIGLETRFGLLLCAAIALAGATLPHPSEPEPEEGLPFSIGEVLSFRAESGRFGSFGTGTMKVEGPEQVRGSAAYRFSFDFKGRIGPFRVEDQTRSWVGIRDFASLRYEKREKSPLGSHVEDVQIFPTDRRWLAADGTSGETGCERPLDELSFIYFLRSLPLNPGDEYTLSHHFDPAKNPARVEVLGREITRVPAGEFPTVVVEMRVQDARLSEKESTMRFHLTDDARRIPVRIESSAPWVGTTRLLLERIDEGG